MDCNQLNDIIKSSKNILIISHLNPDGDTLGSMCGMYSAIRDNFKKQADMLLLSKVPSVYEFLPYISGAKHIDEYDKSREYDLVINVDIAAYDRMCEASILFEKAKFTVNIDHHKTNNSYAELNFVYPESSSTGEVLFGLMKEMGWKISLNTAISLYTAILTDTGSFRFDNTGVKAFQYASELVSTGVKPSDIYKKCYESNSKELVQFQAYCLSKAVFEDNDKIAYSVIYKKDIEKFNAGEDCTEGLAEKLRAIITTDVAFIVKQISANLSKISMRSKVIDVAEVCSIFGGGGHKQAAGCVIKASPADAAKKVLEEIRKQEVWRKN
ncbi:TPA: bifunctional oligoribonuclease/PAP phosphatase NrnA [Candidatus Scatousia excrementigallinarum]|uniref:Bifunctional oligoribonuclease/PAP phosphatase NrnA n=1 Tax=Candidatus Scatousia excrementigallinarum TaxID=2840935 RepID=A0A9D1EZ02_9BACT|nr:bifunctional oligoribonuclease/PAP phosphatase NrnA [Candidatus Scatousia excrementigallinarum]